MHMLAERYAAQHQLHAEPSGLSTITERSETRTTPRGLSFTSNFTHEFTVLSGRPSCELHWEVQAGRHDSYSSQASSACPFAGYTYVPQQHQQQQRAASTAAAAVQQPTVTTSSQSQQGVPHSPSSASSHGEHSQMNAAPDGDEPSIRGVQLPPGAAAHSEMQSAEPATEPRSQLRLQQHAALRASLPLAAAAMRAPASILVPVRL
jgi:hypothetical protein